MLLIVNDYLSKNNKSKKEQSKTKQETGRPIGPSGFLYDIEKGEGKWCVSIKLSA